MRNYKPKQIPKWIHMKNKRAKCGLTSVKCHWLSKNNRTVEGDQDGLFVRAATDLLLQSIAQTDSSAEVRHLVEI